MTNPNTQHTDTLNSGVLRRNLAQFRKTLAIVLCFGALVNLLALSAPLFALQVYDRVLGSRSEETLLVLIGLLAIALIGMGAIDHFRRRILAHIGLSLANALAPHVRHAEMTGGPTTRHLHHRLDHLHNACAAPALAALLDLPWTPLFLGGLFLFHPLLGWWALGLAIASGLYIWVTWAGHSTPENATPAEVPAPMPGPSAVQKFTQLTTKARTRNQEKADRVARLSATMATARSFAQSLTIALAALLVLRGALTPGAILASTVLLARFLAPFDQLGAGTPALRLGWAALRDLRNLPSLPQDTTNPAKGGFSVKNLTAMSARSAGPYLNAITFTLKPGQTMGIIGPSGVGKSALLAHLSGQTPQHMGTIVPQPSLRTTVFIPQVIDLTGQRPGDVVSGHHPNPDIKRLWQALAEMGLDTVIRALPDGLDHQINPASLSSGQMRALALARLAYQQPNIALLDEPLHGLDADFRRHLQRLLASLARTGAITLVATQQPSALTQADCLLVLDQGRQTAFGPAADIIAATTRNVATLGPTPLKRQQA